MEDTQIYGVDTSTSVTPVQVRDALLQCFMEAHADCLELDTPNEEVTEQMIRMHVENAFKESGGNFSAPTKESILKAMDHLKSFAANFRNQDVIQAHYQKMLGLIDCCMTE